MMMQQQRQMLPQQQQRALVARRPLAAAASAAAVAPRLAALAAAAARAPAARRRPLPPRRAAAAGGAGAAADEPEPSPQPPANTGVAGRVLDVFRVFSDPACNSKLIALALGQMLCSIATLMHDSYLPVYVQDELGLSNTKIGAVQGVAQFLCQLTKGVSGVAGDVLGSQVRVLVFGTFLTFVCKPMFALLSTVYGVAGVSATVYWYFFAKLLDRMSKGIREAPTKAVMNELALRSGETPDAAYGLRQSLATAGALIGSTVSTLVFIGTGHNYIATFAAASVPPLFALAWLVAQFKDDLLGRGDEAKANARAKVDKAAAIAAAAAKRAADGQDPLEDEKPFTLLQKARALVGAFKPAYWQALLVVAALYFARFDASFVSLRAKQVMARGAIPMLFFVSSLIQTFLTAPLAKAAGTGVATRNKLLAAGFFAMVAANFCFGSSLCATPAGMFAGASLLGLHMALTHSITVSMVASYMPTGEVKGVGKLSGTAVSFTDFLLGFVLAASNVLAGRLSDAAQQAGHGNVGCFAGGAVACGAALVLLVLFARFGALGRDDEIVAKARKPKPA